MIKKHVQNSKNDIDRIDGFNMVAVECSMSCWQVQPNIDTANSQATTLTGVPHGLTPNILLGYEMLRFTRKTLATSRSVTPICKPVPQVPATGLLRRFRLALFLRLIPWENNSNMWLSA